MQLYVLNDKMDDIQQDDLHTYMFYTNLFVNVNVDVKDKKVLHNIKKRKSNTWTFIREGNILS